MEQKFPCFAAKIIRFLFFSHLQVSKTWKDKSFYTFQCTNTKHFSSLHAPQHRHESLTKASATASSTSEPVFRTLIALTDEDNLLDWLIPKLVPVKSSTKKKEKKTKQTSVRTVTQNINTILTLKKPKQKKSICLMFLINHIGAKIWMFSSQHL